MKDTQQKKTEDATASKAEISDEAILATLAGEEVKPEVKKVKKAKRQILKGRATIKCSYNNTIINISDSTGSVLSWASSGLMGFKGAKKATPYAATQVVASVAEKVKKYGMKELEVFVRGVGSGREASIRALANNGFEIVSIKDTTPIPHNGCRAKRPRRI